MAYDWNLLLHSGFGCYLLGYLEKKEQSLFRQKKMLTNPLEIISHACAMLSYWVGLYSKEMQATILAGVRTLLSCAHRVLAQPSIPPPPLLTQAAFEEDEDDCEDDL